MAVHSVDTSVLLDRDSKVMQRCIELAQRAAGQTRPNPVVGCVILSSDGSLLGEGFHTRAGRDHAEVDALKDAEKRGFNVQGATAFVNLEPCNHYGRTPPCSQALVRAKVRRVVVGMTDPDPRVSGAGIQTLRNAGIDVTVGVEERLCQRINEGFRRRIVHRAPFGILKYAMTVDGKIATTIGSSKWVTGPDSRQHVQSLRSRVDAIIVGGQTVRMDDPRLTVRSDISDNSSPRPEDALSPLRVVMTKSMDLPRSARLWNDTETAETVILTTTSHGKSAFVNDLRSRGVTVHEVSGLQPRDAMDYLYDRECLNVLWECGGALSAQAIADGAVQKIEAYIAPKLVGGAHAPSPIGAPALCEQMTDAVQLVDREVRTFENGDILISGYVVR